jgi:hypothetical protein
LGGFNIDSWASVVYFFFGFIFILNLSSNKKAAFRKSNWDFCSNNGPIVFYRNAKCLFSINNRTLYCRYGSWTFTKSIVEKAIDDSFMTDWPNFTGTIFTSPLSLPNTSATLSIKDGYGKVLDTDLPQGQTSG